MRRRNHSTTRPAFLSAFVLAFLLISASNLGAALAAGPIRTQPSRSAPIPPLPVASSAVTLAPRNPVMTATIDQLDAFGSSTGLSVAQESELIVAAIGVFNVINRDPTLTRQAEPQPTETSRERSQRFLVFLFAFFAFLLRQQKSSHGGKRQTLSTSSML